MTCFDSSVLLLVFAGTAVEAGGLVTAVVGFGATFVAEGFATTGAFVLDAAVIGAVAAYVVVLVGAVAVAGLGAEVGVAGFPAFVCKRSVEPILVLLMASVAVFCLLLFTGWLISESFILLNYYLYFGWTLIIN